MVPTGHGYLAVEEAGDPNGSPVFLLHGMPGSRSGPKPRASVLYRRGVRLISYDRPGYGESTRRKGRTVVDAAEDVRVIADELNVERFSVVGRSGGGPHALACAARLGDRVARTATLVSVAPPDAEDLDFLEGMAEGNIDAYATSGIDADGVAAVLRSRAAQVSDDPDSLLAGLHAEMTHLDRRVVKDVGIRRTLAEAYAEALKYGADGWVDDLMALRSSWRFQLDEVTCPVLLWHGEDDNFSPVSHTYWLAKRMPRARVEVRIEPATAHFGAVKVLLGMFDWLTDWPEDGPDERPDRVARAEVSAGVSHHLADISHRLADVAVH